MNRAVFLDRDNTLIHNDGDLGDPEQVRLIQGAASAIASLRGLGYRIVVVTNQGGVARGKFTEADVERVHARIVELVKAASNTHIDRFYFCPHHPEAVEEKYRSDHPWRKPQPGMLKQAAIDLKLDLASSWMVGDAMRDIAAGQAAGTRTILLTELTDDSAPPKAGDSDIKPDFIVHNLIEAVRIIAQAPRPGREPEPPPPIISPQREGPSQSTPRSAKPGDEVLRIPGVSASRPAATATLNPLNPLHPKPKITPPPKASTPQAPQPPPPALPTPVPAVPLLPNPQPLIPSPSLSGLPENDETATDLLRQIARLLKAQNADLGDFSYAKMCAAVAQMLTFGCALFGLFYITNPAIYAQWFLAAILMQLFVIALLFVVRK